MQLLVYILLYPLLKLISLLPFRLLYVLSDFVYLIIYYVVGYRKETVRHNLRLALPHLSDQERLKIEKASFRHLCDMFLEMIKTISISRKEIDSRFTYENLDVYLNLEKKQKSIALMCAHYASYEWVISMNSKITFEGFAIYKKIANKYFDKLVRDIRSRFKATLITTKETIKTIEDNHHTKHLGVYGFASDQSPKANKVAHWGTFMEIETPIHTGAEMLAKKFDMNVIFLKVKKIKRGFYRASFEILTENASSVPDYQISDRFMKKVEEQILEAPEYYLWTHKRWKHTKP
ncbi:MAG: lipid A biosynthesis acyltransferase [Flavobacteriaceae bacterium]|jgi:KDO2-lipid IV(A) lauroyltransferase|nr:lipid A biosynthesis acyltransferase [Flavobacteriaceae bacterium]